MTWELVSICDPAARSLADRHYSRQKPGSRDFVPPGQRLCLLTRDNLAVWATVSNLDPRGGLHWRCSIFRNEGPFLSSALIREATAVTYREWIARYGVFPGVPLRTEIDASATAARRGKRNLPGHCFLMAGWRYLGIIGGSRRKLHVYEAPPP